MIIRYPRLDLATFLYSLSYRPSEEIVGRGSGICHQISHFDRERERGVGTSPESVRLVQRLSQGWPKATGLRGYPVPHPTMPPAEAFLQPLREMPRTRKVVSVRSSSVRNRIVP